MRNYDIFDSFFFNFPWQKKFKSLSLKLFTHYFYEYTDIIYPYNKHSYEYNIVSRELYLKKLYIKLIRINFIKS